MTKVPSPAANGKRDKETTQKRSITQRLRTDLRRSVGVTTSAQQPTKRKGHKNRYKYSKGNKYYISQKIYIYSDIRIGQAMLRPSGEELRSDD